MLKGKSFLDNIKLLYPNECEENDKIILKCFKRHETKTFFHEQIYEKGEINKIYCIKRLSVKSRKFEKLQIF